MAQNSQAVIPDNIILVDGELNPVPTPEAGDSGKVLTVVNEDGTIGWSPVSSSGTQLQADWSVTDTSSVQYIANKPDLSVYATSSDVTTALAGKQDTISDLSDIRSGAEAGATAVQPADLSDYVEASSLAAVATSGSYNDLTNKPTIPTKGSLMVKSGTTQKELYDAWAAGWTIQSNRGNELNVYELSHFEHEFGEYTANFSRVYFADALIYEESFAIDGITDSTSAVSFGSKTTRTSNRVPAADSQTVGKVLTIKSVPDDDPIASWETPSGGTTYSAGDGIAIDGNNVVSADVDGSTIGIDSTTKKIKLLATIPTVDQTYNASSTNAQSGTAVANAVSNAVSGLDEVPTVTSSDNGKVLKATYSGGQGSYAWDTAPGGTTYTAGNMISINGNNAIGVSTTAGITDIQQVNVLPANPVSTVLYLIPET